MIWNSSCGDGILPVDILDQIGISFNEISNAPEAINYGFQKSKIRKTSLFIQIQIAHLSFQHIAEEKGHHASKQFVF